MGTAHNRPAGPAVLFALALALGVTVRSAPAQDASPLTLPAAVERALSLSPALAAAQAEVSAATAQIDQAALRPPLEASLEFENFAGSGELEGTDALESTLQLSRSLELGGKRDRRIDTARANRDAAMAGLDVARLDLAASVTRSFLTLLEAQEQLSSTRRSLELAQAIRAQAERRVGAGGALSAELHRARAAVGRARLFVARAEAETDVAWRTLAATWGEPNAPRIQAAGDLFAAPELEPLPTLLARLEQSPRLTALAAGERLREAERRLAEAQARPDLALSLGVRRLNEVDDTGLVAGVAVPFGSRARSRPLVAESGARLEQARAERAAQTASAMAAVGGLHSEATTRRAALQLLQDEILPATAAALQQIERGYRLGRLSYSDYALAARESIDAEFDRIRIAGEYHQLLTEIESLTGGPRPSGASKP